MSSKPSLNSEKLIAACAKMEKDARRFRRRGNRNWYAALPAATATLFLSFNIVENPNEWWQAAASLGLTLAFLRASAKCEKKEDQVKGKINGLRGKSAWKQKPGTAAA